MRIKQFFKRYIFYIGIGLICLLGIELFAYASYKKLKQPAEFIETQEMKEAATCSGFSNPLDAAEYLVESYREENIDHILRISAIEGKTYGISLGKLFAQDGEFSFSEYPLPSQMYQEYVPLSRNIIGGEAVDMYEEFKHQLRNDVSGIEIIRTDFIRPSEQMSSDYSYKMKLLSEMWGASNMTDVAVLFKNGNNYFTTVLKMASYNSNWYFFDNQSDLVDTSSKSCVWKTTLEEYKALCGEQQEQNDYAVSLGMDINHELQGELQAENLPVNYKISNQIASTSASEALNSVVLAMRKGNLDECLCYCDLYDDEDEIVVEEVIERQADISRELQKFYYKLIIRSLEDGMSLEDLQLTGDTLENWLSPWLVRYMTLVRADVYQIEEDRIEMIITFRYSNEEINTGWTFSKGKQGWKLSSLGAESMGYEVGEIR